MNSNVLTQNYQKKNEYEKRRLKYIDVGKGLGIILIVLGHVLKDGMLRQFIFSFHVPMFFFFSGITFHIHQNKKSFFLVKFKQILIPYLFFSILSIILYQFFGILIATSLNKNVQDNIILNIFGMIYGNSRNGYMQWNQPLWFLPCYFSLYIFIEIFETINQKFFLKNKKIIRIVFIILCFGFMLSYNKIEYPILPFGFETIFISFPFFELGISFKDFINGRKIIIKKRNTLLIFLLCVFLCFFVSNINGFAQMRDLNFGKYSLLFLISSLLGLISILFLSFYLEENQILNYMGKNTIPILVLHKFPILFFQTICPYFKDILKNGDNFITIIVSLIVTFIVIFFSLLCNEFIENHCSFLLGK